MSDLFDFEIRPCCSYCVLDSWERPRLQQMALSSQRHGSSRGVHRSCDSASRSLPVPSHARQSATSSHRRRRSAVESARRHGPTSATGHRCDAVSLPNLEINCVCFLGFLSLRGVSTLYCAIAVESHTVIYAANSCSLLIIISFPSPTHSFIPGLKPSFSENPSHCSFSFFFRTDYIIPQTVYCYFGAYPFLLF